MVKFASVGLSEVSREKKIQENYRTFVETCATRLDCHSYFGSHLSYVTRPFSSVLEKARTLPERLGFPVIWDSPYPARRKCWAVAWNSPHGKKILVNPGVSRYDMPRILAHETGHLAMDHQGSIKWNQVHEFEAEFFSFLFNLENGYSTFDESLNYVTAPIFFRRSRRLEEVAKRSEERVIEQVLRALDLVQ